MPESSDDFFTAPASSGLGRGLQALPLAARMRPRCLAEYIGQDHLLGPGKLLRRAIEADRVTSLILYGPPGVGKTTLAQVIGRETRSRFVVLSGVESSVADIRREAEAARLWSSSQGQSTILFVDEIHRFNKAQQDVLLPHLENGTLRFIGATTHNPYFYVNSPLVSRSQVFTLEPLSQSDLMELMLRTLADEQRGLGATRIRLDAAAAEHLARVSDGDARKCLGALELAALSTSPNSDGLVVIDLSAAEQSVQQKAVVYDADGDAHYDTASAFIKSIRGSDPDAAIYWLAKMLHGGEDLRFITRRLMIAASEDIGLADSNALRVAVAAQQAVEVVGMPEAALILAHAALYLATAPKSNSATRAIGAAMEDVRQGRSLPVPKHLRDAHYQGAKAMGHGVGYQNPHDHPDGTLPQRYMEGGRRYYEPTSHGLEGRIAERLEHFRRLWSGAAAEGAVSVSSPPSTQ